MLESAINRIHQVEVLPDTTRPNEMFLISADDGIIFDIVVTGHDNVARRLPTADGLTLDSFVQGSGVALDKDTATNTITVSLDSDPLTVTQVQVLITELETSRVL